MRVLKETNTGKRTATLYMDEQEFSTISHLFRDWMKTLVFEYYICNSDLLRFGHKGYKWSLNAMKMVTVEGEIRYHIFGTCGDYGFGFGHGMSCRNSGNIRAARAVYRKFFKMLDEKPGAIAGEHYGI